MTLAELSDMARARELSNWDMAAAAMTLLANINRDPKKHGPYKLADFHPYRQRLASGTRITSDNIGMLKNLFVKE